MSPSWLVSAPRPAAAKLVPRWLCPALETTGPDYVGGVADRPQPVQVLEPSRALDLFGGGLATSDVHPLSGTSLVVVRTEDPEPLEPLMEITRDCACVVIGVGPDRPGQLGELGAIAERGCDLLLTACGGPPAPWVGAPDVDRALETIGGTVSSAPLASLSLVQLLRANAALSVHDALVAESWVYSMLQSGARFRQWLRQNPGRRRRATSGSEAPVILSRDRGRLDIELNRPRVHNALDMAMREALIDALSAVVADPSIEEVRLSGRGPSFSSGGDLAEFGTGPDPVSTHVVRVVRSVGAWMARCSDRLTVDLHGSCVGAGIELAAFAGRVRAASGTRIALPELSMGLIPGAGGTVSITRRIGRQRTAYLALSGSVIPAQLARHWGLVDEVVL